MESGITRPMLSHQYQIAILGRTHGKVARLKRVLAQQADDLGLDRKAIRFLDHSTIETRDKKAPLVAVFFGYWGAQDTAHPYLMHLVQESVVILPVFDTSMRVGDYIPASISHINAVNEGALDHRFSMLGNYILEALRLLRQTRRLFISYRRMEAQTIAIQLYECLDARGFDVFLDTHSVPPGEPFQDVLWHRLADTDVVVLLDTPDFLDSQWTQEELAHANTTNVQILQVIWPGNSTPAASVFSRFYMLQAASFTGSKQIGRKARLKTKPLRDIAAEVESLRARALAARHAYLVNSFCKEATKLCLAPTFSSNKIIDVEIGGTGNVLSVIAAVGVPDAHLYQEMEEHFASGGVKPAKIWLLYDERGIRKRWLEHLSWLDGYATIKSVRVSRCYDELKKLVP